MCGICGVWEYGAAEGRVESSLIVSMRDEMSHRGPDDAGESVFDSGRGGLGFRRLSIIDLSPAGNQPMRGCTDRLSLVFNGEIYNHLDIRKELERKGHLYRSRTDSETILHLYEEQGLDFVQAIDGDFAIALWDAARERLILARDRLGVKPLYYYHHNGRFIFASEIKAILKHPTVTPEVDERSLYHYLTFLAAPAPGTLFRDIQKIPAGHMLVLTRNGEVQASRYWDALPAPEPASGPICVEECKQEIRRLLRDSIRKRTMSDVPFGAFLSGGVDSSANVALMSELVAEPVRTFTVGFKDDDELNELDSARAIAKRFGTDHHEVIVGADEMMRFLPDLVFHQDEPLADPVCIPLYYVAKLSRDSGTPVVQVGEGSDEIFAGYEWFAKYLRIQSHFWRFAQHLPASARHVAAAVAMPLLEVVGNKRTVVDIVRRLGAGENLFWGGVVVYDEGLKTRLLSPVFRERIGRISSYEAVQQHLIHICTVRPQADFAAQMTYLELKMRLPELLLTRVDKMTMAASVEARVPFLDHHLVEYALNIPPRLKIEGRSGKHILKQSLEEVLPKDVLYRRKRGFGAPVRKWFQGQTGKLLSDRLLNSTLKRRDFFRYKFIERLLDEHQNGVRDWSFPLWALLNLTLWHERWIHDS